MAKSKEISSSDDFTGFPEGNPNIDKYNEDFTNQYNQALVDTHLRLGMSPDDFKAAVDASIASGVKDPYKDVFQSLPHPSDRSKNGWNFYLEMLEHQTGDLRKQTGTRPRDNLDAYIAQLQTDSLGSGRVDRKDVKKLRKQANKSKTPDEIIKATAAAKRLMFDEGSWGEDLRTKNGEAFNEYNSILQAKNNLQPPAGTAGPALTEFVKQRTFAVDKLEKLWDKLTNEEGLEPCQALIVIQMESLEVTRLDPADWVYSTDQNGNRFVIKDSEWKVPDTDEERGKFNNYENLQYEVTKTHCSDAKKQEFKHLKEGRKKLIAQLRGTYTDSVEDLFDGYGPQPNPNAHNPNLRSPNAIVADIDAKNGQLETLLTPDSTAVDAAATKFGRILSNHGTLTHRRLGLRRDPENVKANSIGALDTARSEWINESDNNLNNLTAANILADPAIKTDLVANLDERNTLINEMIDALRQANPSDPEIANWQAKIIDTSNDTALEGYLNGWLPGYIEALNKQYQTDVTAAEAKRADDRYNELSWLSKKMVDGWASLSGKNQGNKVGRFFSRNKILSMVVKAGAIAVPSIAIGFGAAAWLPAGIIGAGINGLAGLVTVGGALTGMKAIGGGVVGKNMDILSAGATTPDTTTIAKIRQQSADQHINNNDLTSTDAAGYFVGRKATEQNQNARRVALGGAVALTAVGIGELFGHWAGGGHADAASGAQTAGPDVPASASDTGGGGTDAGTGYPDPHPAELPNGIDSANGLEGAGSEMAKLLNHMQVPEGGGIINNILNPMMGGDSLAEANNMWAEVLQSNAAHGHGLEYLANTLNDHISGVEVGVNGNDIWIMDTGNAHLDDTAIAILTNTFYK